MEMILSTEEITKRCSTCKELLPTSFFWNNKDKQDGKHYSCKRCFKVKVIDRPSDIYFRHDAKNFTI